jgi:hypothetical protein
LHGLADHFSEIRGPFFLDLFLKLRLFCPYSEQNMALNLRHRTSRSPGAGHLEISIGVSLIVNDLLERKLIFEGATGETLRGRKPTFLYIDSRRRTVVAADIRASEIARMSRIYVL